ncbi:MAG: phosphoglycolate phosphatase [Lautropia sp.]
MNSGGQVPRVDFVAIRALCIDLDGTLLDTIPDLAVAANRMLADLGHAPLAVEAVRRFVGKGAEVLIARTLAAAGQPAAESSAAFAAARRSFYENYRRCNGDAALPYPGVADGVARLRAAGRSLACVTNKPAEFVPQLFERFGLAGSFRFWIAGDTLPVKKPDPGQLLEAARRFGLAPAQVLMVGDSMNDALAARAAGMSIVLVPYGYNEGASVASLDSDGIVASLAELAGHFEAARGLPESADTAR